MLKNIALLFLFVVASNADAPAPVGPPQVFCGEIPTQIYSCLGIPQIISQDVAQKCKTYTKVCDKMTCLFRESGWFDGTAVNKEKVSQHFDTFSKNYPAWSTAIQYAKTACLGRDLPPQGFDLNCPAYDIMICTLASFIKNAQPAQFSTAERCAYTKQYASACPVCPNECFAPAVPYGSCNACVALPRTP